MSIKDYIDNNKLWYKDRLDNEKSNIEILSSGNDERRQTRFKILTDVGIESGDCILDVGCGLADYKNHLDSKGIDVDYHGVDISIELIDKAIELHPETSLEVRDFFEEPFDNNQFDYVVVSQVLNLRMPSVDNHELAKKFINESLRIARKGVSIDFTTDYVDFKEDYLYYHSPEKLFSFAKSLTKRVSLIHSYKAFEFTLYIYPDFEGWSHS